jgi:hypothetical protein
MSNCDDVWDNVASVKQCIHKKNNEANTKEFWNNAEVSNPVNLGMPAPMLHRTASLCVRSGLSGLRLLVVYE